VDRHEEKKDIRICLKKKKEIWWSLMLSLDNWRLFLELGNPVRM